MSGINQENVQRHLEKSINNKMVHLEQGHKFTQFTKNPKNESEGTEPEISTVPKQEEKNLHTTFVYAEIHEITWKIYTGHTVRFYITCIVYDIETEIIQPEYTDETVQVNAVSNIYHTTGNY